MDKNYEKEIRKFNQYNMRLRKVHELIVKLDGDICGEDGVDDIRDELDGARRHLERASMIIATRF